METSSSSDPTPPLAHPTARCGRAEDDGDSARVKGGARGVLLGHLSYSRPKTVAGWLSTGTSPADDGFIKREERNRKQREYRARKRAEESIEQREERNTKQREYRARNKTFTTSTTPGHVHPESGCIDVKMTDVVGVSAIYQASRHDGKENGDPNESSDWLHRNDEYVRQQRSPLMSLHTESSNGVVINTGASSSTAKQLKFRNWYLKMDAPSKENLLQERRDYKKKKATENEQQACPTLAQEEKVDPMLVPPVQTRYVQHIDVEFESALFEPTNQDSDDEDHLRDIEEEEEGCDIGETIKDCETMQKLGEDITFTEDGILGGHFEEQWK